MGLQIIVGVQKWKHPIALDTLFQFWSFTFGLWIGYPIGFSSSLGFGNHVAFNGD
jgi:hypothetical protein